MAEPHVVSALVVKRAELAGLIEHAEKRLAQLRADLASIDGAIRMFAPEIPPVVISPKRHRARGGLFRPCDLPRMVPDALRDATEPLDVRDMARIITRRHGLDAADSKLVTDVADRIGKVLVHKREQGLVVSQPGNLLDARATPFRHR